MKPVLEAFVVYFISLQVRVFAKIHYNTYAVTLTKATEFTPEVVDKTCLLIPDPGPCRSEISMYYYNPRERNCTTFTWGGCQGNGNRFDTRTECLNSCWSKPNEMRSRPKFCKLSFDYGFCFGDLKRWYYDHVWKICKQTIYSGCGGNKNNFYGLEQCEDVCLFGNYNPLARAKHKKEGDLRKVIILNATGGSSKRGKVQTTAASNSTTKQN